MLRYGIVGVIASVVHFLISYFAHKHFLINPFIAHLLGFGFGLITAYFGHYFYSFNDDAKHSKRFPKFFMTSLTALILHEGGVYILVDVYYLDYSHQVLPLLLVTVPAVTFLMSTFWVFSKQK
jgi:putative flippase GtrA